MHEHDASCAFGNPTCPAYGESPEPAPRSMADNWQRLSDALRRLARFLTPPPAYANGGHVSIRPSTPPSQRPTPQPPQPDSDPRPTVDVLDETALTLADLAFLDERARGATSAAALRYAVIAYRWATINRTTLTQGTIYPSLTDWRTYRATLQEITP